MENAQVTFTYFNVRGLGEVSRMIFAYGGKEFKDVRVNHEEWANLKKTMPLEQMPILDIDGEVFTQSSAIQSFLAKEFGLYPKTNKEQMIVDIVEGVHQDMVKTQARWFYQPDSPEKVEMGAQAIKDTAKFLSYLEGMLAKSGTGYFVGTSVTLADLIMYDVITGYCKNSIEFSAEKYPLIAQNNENVLKVDSIKAYVDKRPDSKM